MKFNNNLKLRTQVILSIGLCFLLAITLSSQESINIDSLELELSNKQHEPSTQLNILRKLAVHHTTNEQNLYYSNLLIEKALELGSKEFQIHGLVEKGNALRIKGELSAALESYLQAATISSQEDLQRQFGVINISVADVYSVMANSSNAVKYYHKGIDILEEEKDSINVASALLNLGDEYVNMGELDSAMIYTKASSVLFRDLNYKLGQAYGVGNMGTIHASLGNDRQAEKDMNEAIDIMEELEEYYPIAVYLHYISDIYAEKKDYKKALSYAHQSLDLAEAHGLKDQISDANLKISELYETTKNTDKSFEHYKSHIQYRDSVNNLDVVAKMADLRTDFEVSQKQVEVDLLNEQKRNQQIIGYAMTIIIILALILLSTLWWYYKSISKQKKRSDELLLNILPAETAKELKEHGTVKAKNFDSATVLFTDFKGFTSYSSNLSPEELVGVVHFYFSKFDEIIESHGLEKIKTIGDAYMCAGGLPFETEDHAKKMVLAALDIAAFVKEEKEKDEGQSRFDIRIGINTGKVVAGVVGFKKFAYDIWGDAVNIAARMESNSEPGRINVSENTYQMIKEDFDCEYRGELQAKNKGLLKMYFVNGKKAV